MSDSASPSLPLETAQQVRQPEIDWLRAFAVLMVVVVHAAGMFGSPRGYYLNPGDAYTPLIYVCAALKPWHMPILFLLSGMATWYGLGRRSTGRYAWERTKRLVVPLVFGTAVLIPPQLYLMRLTDGSYQGSFLAWYPQFFNAFWPRGNFTYAHLWFIAYLWVFSLIALPALILLRRERPRRWIARLADFCLRHHGAILLCALPMAVSESLLHARFPWNYVIYADWAMFTWYLLLFLWGYVLCSDDRFHDVIDRDGRLAFGLAWVCLILYVSRWMMGMRMWPAYTLEWTVFRVFAAVQTWAWMIALLWLGRRFLRVSNRLLPYVREGSYPFYVIHQTVMMGAGYFICFWEIHVLVRFGLLVVATTVGTILAYEILVRRWAPMRFLLGLRVKPRETRAADVRPQPATVGS